MIKCYHCQSRQFDGTIFCSECGANLLVATRSIGQTPPQAVASNLPLASAFEPERALQAQLVVQPSGRRITLSLSDELLIGRADQNKGIVPDVDLGRDGGLDAGVSRRHAIVSTRNGIVHIEDLSSANGTFVNGRQIPPSTPTALQHGDELRCGALKLRIELS